MVSKGANLNIEHEMSLAAQLQQRGDLSGAAVMYQKILKVQPSLSVAHYNLALIHKAHQKFGAAEKSFKSALLANPQYSLARQAFTQFLADRGKFKDALRIALKTCDLTASSPESLQQLADLLQTASSNDLGALGREAFLRCLGRRDVDCDGTILAALHILKSQPVFRQLLRPGQSNEQIATLIAQNIARIIQAMNEPLIARFFAYLILPTPETEKFIAQLRTYLQAALNHDSDPLYLETSALISLQLELREYSLPLLPKSKPTAENSIAYACREALSLPLSPSDAQELLQNNESDLSELPWTRLLLNRFGILNKLEIETAKTLKSLDPITDPTALKVQEQYEESPYPRWYGLRHGSNTNLSALVKRLFPAITTQQISASPNILVAGCGTGRHALRTAIRLEGATVTAIDLSRRSLAYGQLRATELGIQNIHFMQSDISRLPEAFDQFDLIECCGVLHHMAEPEKGWAKLVKLLKPNGLMKVALYSEKARLDVVVTRDFLNMDPDTVSLDDIRAAREKLLALPDTHEASSVTRELDFYSLSGCRDFLFHRQEHRFTFERIKHALDTLGLEFIGFEFVDPEPIEAYRKTYPSDPKATNLENWSRAEQMAPHLFRGMYQFWCRQKR